MPLGPFAIGLLVACAVTAVLVRVAARLELLDHPTERSSHVRVTPRGGGVAIVIGAGAGILASSERVPAVAALLVGGAGALALVGLAGAQAVVTGIGVALVAWDPMAAVNAASVAGAGAGFLAFNWAPARIFMGDTGSLALGYTLASLPLLAPLNSRPEAVFWMVMSLWLFLADATCTLVTRVVRGETWHAPHRDHVYQRLVRAGASHGAVAAWPGIGGRAGWALLAVALGLFVTEAAVARHRDAAVNAG